MKIDYFDSFSRIKMSKQSQTQKILLQLYLDPLTLAEKDSIVRRKTPQLAAERNIEILQKKLDQKLTAEEKETIRQMWEAEFWR